MAQQYPRSSSGLVVSLSANRRRARLSAGGRRCRAGAARTPDGVSGILFGGRARRNIAETRTYLVPKPADGYAGHKAYRLLVTRVAGRPSGESRVSIQELRLFTAEEFPDPCDGLDRVAAGKQLPARSLLLLLLLTASGHSGRLRAPEKKIARRFIAHQSAAAPQHYNQPAAATAGLHVPRHRLTRQHNTWLFISA